LEVAGNAARKIMSHSFKQVLKTKFCVNMGRLAYTRINRNRRSVYLLLRMAFSRRHYNEELLGGELSFKNAYGCASHVETLPRWQHHRNSDSWIEALTL
jgi:hypothetical protein